MRLFSAQARWTWSFPVGQKLTSIRIDGTNYNNCNTRDTFAAFYDYPVCGLQGLQSTRRLRTYSSSANSWIQGWGYGSGISGSTSCSRKACRRYSSSTRTPDTPWHSDCRRAASTARVTSAVVALPPMSGVCGPLACTCATAALMRPAAALSADGSAAEGRADA